MPERDQWLSEALADISRGLGRVEAGMAGLDKRVDGVDKTLYRVDKRLDAVDEKFKLLPCPEHAGELYEVRQYVKKQEKDNDRLSTWKGKLALVLTGAMLATCSGLATWKMQRILEEGARAPVSSEYKAPTPVPVKLPLPVREELPDVVGATDALTGLTGAN